MVFSFPCSEPAVFGWTGQYSRLSVDTSAFGLNTECFWNGNFKVDKAVRRNRISVRRHNLEVRPRLVENLYRFAPMLRRKVGVAQRHPIIAVTQQLSDGVEINGPHREA